MQSQSKSHTTTLLFALVVIALLAITTSYFLGQINSLNSEVQALGTSVATLLPPTATPTATATPLPGLGLVKFSPDANTDCAFTYKWVDARVEIISVGCVEHNLTIVRTPEAIGDRR